jgi:hypothetical protein
VAENVKKTMTFLVLEKERDNKVKIEKKNRRKKKLWIDG